MAAALSGASPSVAQTAAEASGGATQPLSPQSIYHVDATWERVGGEPMRLVELAGHPTVVVMFYGTCRHACPILLRDAQRTLDAVPEALRGDVRIVMVTINPAVDTLESLVELVASYEFDTSQWHFLRADETATRTLAAVLGIQYRDSGDGQLSHSNLITLLDRDGVIVHQTEGLGRPVEPLVDVIVAMGPP